MRLIQEKVEEVRPARVVFDSLSEMRLLAQDPLRYRRQVLALKLPGMNGRELAEIARTHRPELPILFITGYAENAAIRAGFVGQNMAMVTKPFRLEELAGKINEMIGANSSGAVAAGNM